MGFITPIESVSSQRFILRRQKAEGRGQKDPCLKDRGFK